MSTGTTPLLKPKAVLRGRLTLLALIVFLRCRLSLQKPFLVIIGMSQE